MSGHSKWSTIKRKKEATDQKRSKMFAKLLRAIEVAAREGGGSVDGNMTLASAVEKAREASVPNENIERAIKRGAGELEGARYEEVTYEGYAPGGVAVLVEALTDNRNRTGSEVRHAFSKHGGSLGEPGSVAWNFEKKGVIVVDADRYTEDDLMPAIDAGAEDVAIDENVYEVIAEPADFTAVREALEQAGVDIQSADLTMRATNRVPVDEAQVGTLMRLIEALEDHDDVNAVHANFDVDAAVLERVLA